MAALCKIIPELRILRCSIYLPICTNKLQTSPDTRSHSTSLFCLPYVCYKARFCSGHKMSSNLFQLHGCWLWYSQVTGEGGFLLSKHGPSLLSNCAKSSYLPASRADFKTRMMRQLGNVCQGVQNLSSSYRMTKVGRFKSRT